jgi:hypothetical protein
MLSSCTRIGEQDLLMPIASHAVFTVAGQGWLAGPKPFLDAPRDLAKGVAGYQSRKK